MTGKRVRNLIPHFIQEQILSDDLHGCHDGYAMFVDLSGFTRLTETLLKEGKSGAERLSDILNAIFEPMVSLVYDHGGFIPHFAGDAFFGIFFEYQSSITAVQMLALAQKNFDLLKKASPKFKEFDIKIKIGLSYGKIEWGIVGQEYKSFYFRGDAIEGCAQSQAKAQQQQVIVDDKFAKRLDDTSVITPLPDTGYYKVSSSEDIEALDNSLRDVTKRKMVALENKSLSHFLPEAIVQFNQQGEFRTVISIFISFMGLDEHTKLDEFATVVLDQARNFSGYFKEIEFADKGGVLVVIFGAPVSFENNIERALEFISTLEEELLPMQHTSDLRYKIGAATGIAYTGIVGGAQRCQYAAVGNRVNIAARLMMKAEWGEVLVDEEIHKNPHFRFRHKGDITYKGLEKSIPTYHFIGRNVEYRQAFSGIMVGRRNEIQRLIGLAREAFENKQPIIAYLYGEAGIGKSRLSFELQRQLRKMQRMRWITCPSDQILRKPFNPFIFFLKNYFAKSSDNNHSVNLDNFERKFAALINELVVVQHPQAERVKREVIRTKPILAALTGLKTSNSLWDNLDARGRYENIFAALKSLFQAEALIRPLVIELEDGHWLDSSSKEFLDELINSLKGLSVFFLVTSRFDDEGNRPKVFNENLLDKLGIQTVSIDLNILDGHALRDFAKERLQGGISPELYELLLKTTNGNPFYAEQILEYFTESNQLIKTNGKWNIRDKNVRISDSIHSILTARIDRLSALVKETIKAAAVIGREFELPVLSEVMKDNQAFSSSSNNTTVILKEQIKTAEKAQIWQAMNELRYIFRHSLLREAVYDMQLKARLKELHKLIARAIENLYGKNLEQRYVDLVFHYEQAEVYDKLKEYLLKAADFSKANYQNTQALYFYDKLLHLIESENKEENAVSLTHKAEIYLKKGTILELTGEWEECAAIYEKVLLLAQKVNNSTLLGKANNHLGYLMMMKGEYDQADSYLETAAAFFGSVHDNRGTSKVYGNLGTLYFRQGKYEDAKLYFIRSIQLAQLYKHTPSNAQIVATLGLTYMNLGKYDDGIRWQQSQLELCKRVNDRQGMSTLYVNIGIVYFEKGDYDAALECYEKGLELSEELGNKQLTAIAIGCIGNVWQQKGDFDNAMQHFEQDLVITEELGDKQGISIALGLIGELHSIRGEFDEAIDYMEKNLEICKELGYQKGLAKALNNLGDIYYYKREYESSIDYYDRSIEVTRSIGNKLVLGLSLVEKGQVLLTTGKTGEAEKHLNEALEIAADLDQPDLLFEARLLSAKMAAAQGTNKKAVEILEGLLDDNLSKKDKAAIYFELSHIQQKKHYKQKALTLYEKLYNETPMYLFKIRIDELKAKPIA